MKHIALANTIVLSTTADVARMHSIDETLADLIARNEGSARVLRTNGFADKAATYELRANSLRSAARNLASYRAARA